MITESTDPSEFYHSIYTTVRDLFDTLDRETPRANVLVNTCQELEEGALTAVGTYDALPIGPVAPSGDEAGLFEQDDVKYMEWLDAKPADSVVEQLDELLLGLEESGKPYLCVVRKDVKAELADGEATLEPETEARLGLRNGIVVEWCDQVRVLSHAARMNAWLVECEWRVGARAEVGSDGVLRAAEVRRRVEVVMQEGEAGTGDARRAASEWKRVVAEALGKGGSSDRNLRAFVEAVDSGVSV
uniref:Indole-3-acetate beta-glucosyltransferase 1 n=1 Tax=Aegilops tauschii TaxID=37682 RepID=M8CZW9_AEGTA